MKKVLLGVILGVAAMYAWNRARAPQATPARAAALTDDSPVEREDGTSPATPRYQCDGRVYCSQMTSCDEAMFFLHNCPGVKMDGEGDGVPCEKQWCGSL
jgi:hypothetical protein